MRQQQINSSVEATDDTERTFHVGVKRGEVANRILTVNDHTRALTLSKFLDKHPKPFTLEHGGFLTITGRYKKVPVSIISVMMGYTMTDIFLREIRQVVDGELIIIRLGTCDSIGNPNIGDVIVPSGSFSVTRNYDYFIRGVDTVDCLPIVDNPYNISKVAYGDEELCRMLEIELTHALYPSPIYTCLNASSDSFYASQGRIDPNFLDDNYELITSIIEKYPDAHIMDMETFILYHLANMCQYNPQPPRKLSDSGNNGEGLTNLNEGSQSSFHSYQQQQQQQQQQSSSTFLKTPTLEINSVTSMASLKSRLTRNSSLTNSSASKYNNNNNSGLKQKHSLSFLKISKSPPSSPSSSNQYNNSNNSFSNYKSFSNSTTHPQITVTTTTNSHITYTNTSSNSYYTHHRNHNSASSFNPSMLSTNNNKNSSSIRTTSAMMIYYDTKTNSQISQEMIQSLEKICGESICNTLIKTQLCYVHEDIGSVWNLDNFENGNGKKKRTRSPKRHNNKDNNKGNNNNNNKDNNNVIMVNGNGNHDNYNNNIINNYNEKSNNKHNNRIIEKRCSNSLDISRYNNINRSIGNLDLLNKHNNNLDFIAGRCSSDMSSERRSRIFDVNHVNHNKIGKIFGGAGGNNEMAGRYSIDVVRNGDVKGYVSFNSRVGNSDNKENNGGKLRRVMSRMLKIKKKNGVR